MAQLKDTIVQGSLRVTDSLYTDNLTVISTTAATSITSTAALKIAGGITTGDDSYFHNSVHIIGSATQDPLIVRAITGCDQWCNTTDTNNNMVRTLYLNRLGGSIIVGTSTINDNLQIDYTTTSTTTQTGALVVKGGVGIGGAINVSNTATFNSPVVETATDGYYINNNSQEYAHLYINAVGTASVTGQAILSLGNALSATTAKNAAGIIRLYATSANVYTDIRTAQGNTGKTLYIPNYNGDMYAVHIAGSTGVGSNTTGSVQPVYIATNGRATAITNPIGVAYGGTGASSLTNERILYSTSTADVASVLTSTTHYVDSTHLAINSTSTPTENLYVNGTTKFNLGNSDTTANNKFVINGNSRYLSFGGAGVQSYNSNGTHNTLFLQYNGGNLQIGDQGMDTTKIRYLYGLLRIPTVGGFWYEGIGTASSDTARSIWFNDDTLSGKPVINSNFTYNPSTKTITAGSLTFVGGTTTNNPSISSSTTLYIASATGGSAASMIFKGWDANLTTPAMAEWARFNSSGKFVIGAPSSPNSVTYTLYVNGNAYFTTALGIDSGGTGATTAKAAANNLQVPYIGYSGTSIANTNVDTCTAGGTYYASNSTNAKTVTGILPSRGGGFKLYTTQSYTSNRATQYYRGANTTIQYRYCDDTTATSPTWTMWRKLVTLPASSTTLAENTIETDNKLQPQYSPIGGVNQPVYIQSDGIPAVCTGAVNRLIYYGTCTTGATTAAKTVNDIDDFPGLTTGVCIRIKFTYQQNVSSGTPTLNVQDTGAVTIKYMGTTNNVRYQWCAGEVLDFVYDGTNWVMQDGGLATTTYYGMTKLYTGAGSNSTSLALTPNSLYAFANGTIAPYYSTSTTYAVGTIVRYSYQLYRCNTAITTAESWTDSHWTELPTLQSQIENKLGLRNGTEENVYTQWNSSNETLEFVFV